MAPSKQRKVIVMKTRKTLCICLTVVAVIAMFAGAIGLGRGEMAHENDTAYAESKISETDAMQALAQRLGAGQTIYSAAGQPIRSEYEDEIFTAGLYEMVDSYRDENRLYQGVASLAAQPEMQGEIMPGASYASILDTAMAVYTDKLQTAEETWHHVAISNGVLLGLGLLGLVLGIIVLSMQDDEAVSEQETQPRWHHRPHTPSPHLT